MFFHRLSSLWQVSTHPGLRKIKKDDDEDDGEGRKNHSTAFKKRLGCDRPAPEKKRSVTKDTKDVRKEFDWGQTGARPKTMPISAPTGDAGGQFQPNLSQDDEDSRAIQEKMVRKPSVPPPRRAALVEEIPGEPIQKEVVQKPNVPPPRRAALAKEVPGTKPDSLLLNMEQLSLGSGDDDGNQVNMGPAGDNAPMKHFVYDPVQCQSQRNAIPRNHQNLEAVRRLYQDDGSHTGASVLPGGEPRPNEGLETAVKADREGAAGQAVIYGTASNMELLVARMVRHNHEGIQEDQDGVLLTRVSLQLL